MMRTILKSKIAHVKVTQAELYYEGSITIDEALLEAADILENEKVEILNVNNGSRIETYAIIGKRNSGIICLNGPSARSAHPGDELIILSYAQVEDSLIKSVKPKIIHVDANNKIKKT